MTEDIRPCSWREKNDSSIKTIYPGGRKEHHEKKNLRSRRWVLALPLAMTLLTGMPAAVFAGDAELDGGSPWTDYVLRIPAWLRNRLTLKSWTQCIRKTAWRI